MLLAALPTGRVGGVGGEAGVELGTMTLVLFEVLAPALQVSVRCDRPGVVRSALSRECQPPGAGHFIR